MKNCAEQSDKDSVREATAEEQVCSKTNHPAMRAQLHLPALDLAWNMVLTSSQTIRLNADGKKGRRGYGGVVEVLLYVHRSRRFIRDGAQDDHLDFHTAPDLCMEVGKEGDYIPIATLSPPGDYIYLSLHCHYQGIIYTYRYTVTTRRLCIAIATLSPPE